MNCFDKTSKCISFQFSYKHKYSTDLNILSFCLACVAWQALKCFNIRHYCSREHSNLVEKILFYFSMIYLTVWKPMNSLMFKNLCLCCRWWFSRTSNTSWWWSTYKSPIRWSKKPKNWCPYSWREVWQSLSSYSGNVSHPNGFPRGIHIHV